MFGGTGTTGFGASTGFSGFGTSTSTVGIKHYV
jgi:hypothetical protein